jgi:predicted RNA-binding Zn ribbon-like protein
MNQLNRSSPSLPFAWIGGTKCLDFTNTVSWHSDGPKEERLQTFADLVEWGREAETLSVGSADALEEESKRHPRKALAALSDALDVRQLIHSVFSDLARGKRVNEVDMGTLNARVSDALLATRIAPDGNRTLKFRRLWSRRSADLYQLIRPVLVDASNLLLSTDLEKVRTCANDECGWLFLDTSRNHMRRWCEMRECGNRAKARRHNERKFVAS